MMIPLSSSPVPWHLPLLTQGSSRAVPSSPEQSKRSSKSMKPLHTQSLSTVNVKTLCIAPLSSKYHRLTLLSILYTKYSRGSTGSLYCQYCTQSTQEVAQAHFTVNIVHKVLNKYHRLTLLSILYTKYSRGMVCVCVDSGGDCELILGHTDRCVSVYQWSQGSKALCLLHTASVSGQVPTYPLLLRGSF